jgi:hypothetical protein
MPDIGLSFQDDRGGLSTAARRIKPQHMVARQLGGNDGRAVTGSLAALTWCAVLLQLVLSLRLATANGKTIAMGLVVYLGFFTVLTNILVAVALTAPAVAPRSAAGRFFADASVLGGVATSIAMVGLAYHVLLREIWAPQGMQWLADVLLHYVIPAAFVVWWFAAAPKARFSYAAPLRWTVWPIAYLVYALARGAVTGLYAYPFINVPAIGYPRALLNSVGLLVEFLLLGQVFVAIARRRAP